MKKRRAFWLYIKNYKSNSIIIKNFLLIALLTIIPLISVSFMVFSSLNKAASEEILSSNSSSAITIRNFIDNIVSEGELILLQMGSDTNVAKFLAYEQNVYPIYDEIQNTASILNTANVIVNSSNFSDSIAIYSVKNDYIIQTGYGGTEREFFYDRNIFEEYEARKDESKKWKVMRLTYNSPTSLTKANYITLMLQLPVNAGTNLGFVAVNIDVDKVETLLSSNQAEEGSLYIIEEDGSVFYSTNADDMGKNISQVESFDNLGELYSKRPRNIDVQSRSYSENIVTISKSNNFSWTYILISPIKAYEEKTKDIQKIIVLLVSISIVLTIIVAFLISINVFKPVKRIIDIIDTHGENLKLSGDKENRALNEYRYIAKEIAAYFNEERTMKAQLQNRQEALKKASAIALQAQINPHFLFNTLETVNWMVLKETKKNSDASKIILALSHIIRLSFSTEKPLVPLFLEIQHATYYIQIQKYRYKGKFDVIWDIDESIKDYLVPKIILQPLIENAIYHGVKPKKSSGIIKITGYQHDGSLYLEIYDDGIGVKKEMMEAFIQSDSMAAIKEDWNIGISNVNQRIKLISGEKYGLSFKSGENAGLTVQIVLPIIKADDKN